MPALPAYDLGAIAERLHRAAPVEDSAHDMPRAAVAVLLRARAPHDEAELFFIERAVKAGDPWSGHMAFPGGRRSPDDRDLRATAVRETREEVGLDLDAHATFLARLPDLPAVLRSADVKIVVSPFVFVMQREVAPSPNHEVASTVWTPIAPIARGERRGVYPYTYQGNVLEFPCHRVEGRVVWGLTFMMLDTLFERLHAEG